MWKLLVILSLGIAWQHVEAAKRIEAIDLVRDTMAKRSLDQPKPTIKELLQLNENEDVDEERSLLTAYDSLKTRYKETYKGIPIYDTIVTADDQDVEDIFGSVVQEVHHDLDDVIPSLTSEEAIDIAKKAQGDTEIVDPETNLFVYVGEDEVARLMYETIYVVETEEKDSRPIYLIDAKTGDVIDHWESLTSHQMKGVGGNEKIGKYMYGQKYDHLEVQMSGGRCVFQNNNVKVIHMNFGKSGSSNAHTVNCNTGANDAINGAYSPVHDGLFFGGVVFNMYKDWYGLKPLTQSLVVRVHYSRNYENAFWDGRQMTFGDGATRFHPLVSLDVMAHEVSHGFTQQNSNLQYRGQSGGMNEAFSDMAGETSENFMRGNNDWKIGYDIFKGSGSMRYMDEPTKDGRSISHVSKYYNGIDVHHSSGIYNKVFYTLSNKAGWSPKKAFEVMIKANRMYWKASTNFVQGSCGVKKAACDNKYNVNDITASFKVVGITIANCNTRCDGSNPNPNPNPTPNPNPNPNPNPTAKKLAVRQRVSLKGFAGANMHFYVDLRARESRTVWLYVGTGSAELYIKKGGPAGTSSTRGRTYKKYKYGRLYSRSSSKYFFMVRGTSNYSNAFIMVQ